MNLEKIRALINELHAEVNVAAAIPPTQGTMGGTIYSDGPHDQPGDPLHPGYKPGDGAQVMDRKYARADGWADSNHYIKSKVAIGVYKEIRWPDEKQDWEE